MSRQPVDNGSSCFTRSSNSSSSSRHRYTSLDNGREQYAFALRPQVVQLTLISLGAALCVSLGWAAAASNGLLPWMEGTATGAGGNSPTTSAFRTDLLFSEENERHNIADKALGQTEHQNQPGISVNVWNDYGMRQSSESLYPWKHVAEPNKVAMMSASWPKEDVWFGGDIDFRWTVDGHTKGTGPKIEEFFDTPGEYKCSVTAFHAFKNSGRSSGTPPSDVTTHTFDVTVKYVRREIRDLTDRDRETFFNAVSVLQRVPSAVGQGVYGKKYYSKDFFNRLHLYYGGQKDCDHWHDGAGFVTSHIALSLMFEQALQSINPSIALPYWDFTIEGTAYDWRDFRSSEVFSDDWFGDAAPRNPLMTPERGRFGFVPVMTNATAYSALYNSYGLLRSPWNNDPNPFLTRHDHISGFVNNRKPAGCKQYRDASRQGSWMSLAQSMNSGAHGHIHELMGGMWSSDWSRFSERTDEVVFPFLHAIVPLMKYLWRVGYLQCPKSCGPELPWEDCQCTCQSYAMPGKRPSEILEGSGLLATSAGAFFYDHDLKLVDILTDEEGHAQSKIPGYTEEETNAIFAEMLQVLCTPMKIGTHYEGTSTNDVTFWVLHPTFDRLWHLSRLEGVPGFNSSWEVESSCYGHNPSDIQPFHSLFLGEGKYEIETSKKGEDMEMKMDGGNIQKSSTSSSGESLTTPYGKAHPAHDEKLYSAPASRGGSPLRAELSYSLDGKQLPASVLAAGEEAAPSSDLMSGSSGEGNDIKGDGKGNAFQVEANDVEINDKNNNDVRAETDAVRAEADGVDEKTKAKVTGNTAGIEVPKTYYTNEELYELFRPDGRAVPYIYEHFEWKHCDAIGVFMTGDKQHSPTP